MAVMNTVETASFQVSLIAGTPSEPAGYAIFNLTPGRSPGKSRRSARQEAEDPAWRRAARNDGAVGPEREAPDGDSQRHSAGAQSQRRIGAQAEHAGLIKNLPGTSVPHCQVSLRVRASGGW